MQKRRIQHYLIVINAEFCYGEVQLLDLSNEELDRALQFVTMQNGQLVPTLCGLLMIGKAPMIQSHVPTAEASIQVLSGTDIKVNESFHLPLLAAFDKINSTFTAWNSSEEMEVGLFRISIPSYEPRAFREALVNAFCHRLWKAFHKRCYAKLIVMQRKFLFYRKQGLFSFFNLA